MTRSRLTTTCSGLVAVAALAAAAPSPGAPAPFVSVAKGGSPRMLERNRVYLATAGRETKRFQYLLDRRARQRVRAVDFRRFDVIGVFYKQARVAIVGVGLRTGRTITLTISVFGRAPACPPGAKCAAYVFTGYHVVAVPKARVGRRPVRLVLSELPATLPFTSVAHGGTTSMGPGAPSLDNARVFLATSRADAEAIAALVDPADRPRVQGVDFDRYAVVALFEVFRSTNHRVDIASVSRDDEALRVTFVPQTIGDIGGAAITLCYHVVQIDKSLLGDPGPAQVIATEVQAAAPQRG